MTRKKNVFCPAQIADAKRRTVEKKNMASTLLKSIAESQFEIQESKSVWKNTPFSAMENLKPDYSGKVGERLLADLCKKSGVNHVWVNDNKNSKDGTYDITILGKKVEVKTARLGVDGAFQHESLRAAGCDFYTFVDVTPTYFYLTIIPKFDMRAKHPVFGRKPHLRKETTNVFKFDLSEFNLKKGIAAGITIKVDADTDATDFIVRQIGCE